MLVIDCDTRKKNDIKLNLPHEITPVNIIISNITHDEYNLRSYISFFLLLFL